MIRTLLYFFNPVRIIQAFRYKRAQKRYDRSEFDLELYLYSKILRNGMLHYGYFEDIGIQAGEISIGMMERAQERYAELIVDAIPGTEGRVLDAGCGMGGLTRILNSRNIEVEALTPNKNQIEHIKKTYPAVKTHHCKYESLNANDSFDVIIHSESLQYIDLEEAFRKTGKILKDHGRWIITDYFRLSEQGQNTSGHLLSNFKDAVSQQGWTIETQRDITENVLPTLKLIWLYAERFLKPVKHFALEKFRFKKPWLYFMTSDLHERIDKKLEKELSAIDPELFKKEKRYMMYVLKK